MHDFWQDHGLIFVVCMFFFPRLTLFFAGLLGGSILWWLGFIFAPRVLVAVGATMLYWPTNPFLCILSWFWAISGETMEKAKVKRWVSQ